MKSEARKVSKMEENCQVNGGGWGFLFSSSPLWSGSISFSFKSVEEKQAFALSPSSQSRRDEQTSEKCRRQNTLNSGKLLISLLLPFFSSFRRGFVRSSKPDKKLLLRRPSCRRLWTRNSELKRSFVKKVSTIYSPFFPLELRTEIRSGLSSVAKWIINDLYEAS